MALGTEPRMVTEPNQHQVTVTPTTFIAEGQKPIEIRTWGTQPCRGDIQSHTLVACPSSPPSSQLCGRRPILPGWRSSRAMASRSSPCSLSSATSLLSCQGIHQCHHHHVAMSLSLSPGSQCLTSALPRSSLAFSLSRSFLRVPSAAVSLKQRR